MSGSRVKFWSIFSISVILEIQGQHFRLLRSVKGGEVRTVSITVIASNFRRHASKKFECPVDTYIRCVQHRVLVAIGYISP